MLKVKSKFRLVIALYMVLPVAIIVWCLRGTGVFLDPSFQSALSICVAVIIFLALCSPLLFGLKWIFLNQVKQISDICMEIKKGRYHYFSLPNEPSETGDENELVFLMRNMNWMIRQIETREAGLESRVAKRTLALEKTNKALIAARDEANASAVAKSQFLATMSHEIRTPMNAIIGMSDLVIQTGLTSRQEEYMGIINASSKSLLKIINDILDFSKIDAGKLAIEKIPVSITELMEEITDVFKHEMADKSVEFILDIDMAVPGCIITDPTRLRQVLINLVSNAVKFTQKGEISLCVEKQSGSSPGSAKLKFSVTDTGIGMDKKAVDNLFRAFTQADGSTSRKYGGTGLGLAISQKLVRLMGGVIRARSTKGKGSCFSFVLDTEIVPRESTSPISGQKQFKDQAVLLAAENKTTSRILEQFLKAFGLSVHVVPDWRTFLKQVEEPLFSLAIVDLDLSDLVRAAGKDEPVCLETRLPVISIGTFNKGFSPDPPSWVKKFIPKPVKQSLLFDAVMEIFDSNNRCTTAGCECPAAPPHPAHPRVLLVEDNRINQKVAIEILQTAGIKPVVVDNGEDAVEWTKNCEWDAIIMDIQMPGMDGYETARLIRRYPGMKDTPIIAMSANALPEDRQKGFDAGMNAYITKPVAADLLFKTLSKCLNRPLIKSRCIIEDEGSKNQCIIKDLPGIDIPDALSRLKGNAALLEELITDFVETHQHDFDHLNQMIESSPPEEILAVLHKIKGISRNLSAVPLADALQSAEARISAMDKPLDIGDASLQLALTQCRDEFTKISRAVRGPMPKDASTCTEVAPPDSLDDAFFDQAVEMADTLERLLNENSIKAKTYVKEFQAQLRATGFEPDARTLASQIKRFDFKAARETFELLDSKIRSTAAEHYRPQSQGTL